ncbi:MAG TPA: ATP-binding protein [Thermoanaerobaculia bacterium]|nr:ATP-binding protein [Thermoanaerobaculia bacterium]
MIARRRWSDLPWRAKLTLLLGLLAALPLVVVTFVNVTAARSELIASSREQNLQRARSTAAAVDSYLEGVLSDLEIVARGPGTVRFLEGSDDPGLRKDLLTTLRQMKETQGFEALLLADPAGRIVLATDDARVGRSIISTRTFLEGISGNSLVHEPRYDPEDGRVYLRASAPVRSAGGPIMGVAVGLVPLEGLDRILKGDTGFAGRSEFGILWDSRGIRLSHPTQPGLRFRPFEPLSPDVADHLVVERRFGPDTRRLLQVSQPVPGVVERSRWLLYERSLDPHLRIEIPSGVTYAEVVPLRSQRWIYGVFSPRSAILAAVDRQIQRTLLVVAVTGLLAIAAGLFAAQWATRPLRLVGQTANAIAAGDMSRRVGLQQADEVGQMAAAFDAMADALSAKEDELRGYAGRLEQRVTEQTAELWEAVENEQEARIRAEEANRLKDEFLSTVSHELRTPLNSILGWTWLLIGEKLDEAGARRAVQTIERNARAQSQIIDDLLDVSRIVTGKLRLKVRTVDLAPLIEAAVDAVRPAAQAKGIQVEARMDTRLSRAGPLRGDPDRLQQVVWNLLANAVKFTPAGGRVEVLADEEDGQACIRVTDTGMGIPDAFLRYVFDRFRQEDSSTTRKHGGLGLGLSIVRHLVELHGGTVSAESEGEGRGATFTVMLPLTSRSEAPELNAEPRPALLQETSTPPSLHGLRVLVVDDEPDARDVVTAALEELGAEVDSMPSAADALASLHRSGADVLVADIGMPGEDGYSLIHKIREIDGILGRLPAIALTAYAGDADRLRALEAGFQIHLPKPIDPGALAEAVAAVAASTERKTTVAGGEVGRGERI